MLPFWGENLSLAGRVRHAPVHRGLSDRALACGRPVRSTGRAAGIDIGVVKNAALGKASLVSALNERGAPSTKATCKDAGLQPGKFPILVLKKISLWVGRARPARSRRWIATGRECRPLLRKAARVAWLHKTCAMNGRGCANRQRAAWLSIGCRYPIRSADLILFSIRASRRAARISSVLLRRRLRFDIGPSVVRQRPRIRELVRPCGSRPRTAVPLRLWWVQGGYRFPSAGPSVASAAISN